jgi:hypothetical protein
MTFNHMQDSKILDNHKVIVDQFMEKFVNNINAHDLSRDDESHDENIHTGPNYSSNTENHPLRGL